MSTLNNNLAANLYDKQYMRSLGTVFGVDKAFANAFLPIQLTDGVKDNEVAFYVKTNNTPVVLGTYSTDANTAFGTGTANSSRFGKRTEVIYTDTPVEYDYNLAFDEGMDSFTVNAELDRAVAQRLIKIAEAQVEEMNARHGEFLATNAGNEIKIADYNDETIIKLFNDLSVYQTNKRVKVKSTAYVNAEIYNAIADSRLTTSGKHSTVDIDGNIVYRFKDFLIVKEPEINFPEGVVAIVAPDGVALPFVGIVVARTIYPEGSVGIALQGAAKGGTFMLDDNKVAVTKVTLGE